MRYRKNRTRKNRTRKNRTRKNKTRKNRTRKNRTRKNRTRKMRGGSDAAAGGAASTLTTLLDEDQQLALQLPPWTEATAEEKSRAISTPTKIEDIGGNSRLYTCPYCLNPIIIDKGSENCKIIRHGANEKSGFVGACPPHMKETEVKSEITRIRQSKNPDLLNIYCFAPLWIDIKSDKLMIHPDGYNS